MSWNPAQTQTEIIEEPIDIINGVEWYRIVCPICKKIIAFRALAGASNFIELPPKEIRCPHFKVKKYGIACWDEPSRCPGFRDDLERAAKIIIEPDIWLIVPVPR